MSDKINKGDNVRRGALNAAAWNRVVESSDAYHLQQATGRPGLLHRDVSSNTSVLVQNDVGSNLRAGEVVEFSGFALGDVTNEDLWFNAATPDLSNIGWGITREPIKYNATSPNLGRCVVLGICAAYVDVTDADHEYAKLVSGSRVLESAVAGPVKIFHKPSGTGEKFCAVLVGVPSLKVYLGKTNGALAKGASGPVHRYSGGSESDTGIDDTVTNKYVNLATGKWVHYVEVDGTFYAIAGECT